MKRQTREPDPLQTAGLASLILASIFLPFEFKIPLFTLGPLGITSAEIGIYITAGLWAAGLSARRRLRWTTTHSCIALWGAVLILSALTAPSHKSEALKFALRGVGGCFLCLAAADFVRTSRAAASVGLALLAGSTLSAVAAQIEIWMPGAAAFLGVFKTEPSRIGMYLRASGTFQYANIASMYWEAALPLALAVPLWWWGRRSGRWWWAGWFGSVLLLEAIYLSASRAGIVIAALILITLILMSKKSRNTMRPLAIASLFSWFLMFALHVAVDDLFLLRLTTSDLSSWYRAEYQDFPERLTLTAGKTVRVPLTIINRGQLAWHAHGRQAVAVSYHWLDPAAENILIWDGTRSELLTDVAPGATTQIEAWLKAPVKPGSYALQWDMLQEKVTWFSMFESNPARSRVSVLASPTSNALPDDIKPIAWPLPSPPDRMALWGAATKMWAHRPFLGVGPDNFRHLYGSFLGLGRFDERIYANNLYLETLANLGLAGLLALLALLAALGACIRMTWRGLTLPEDKLLLAGIAMGLAAFCIHGLVDYFLAFTPTYGQFWILAGTIVGLRQYGEKSR
jgi:hypothetical protein